MVSRSVPPPSAPLLDAGASDPSVRAGNNAPEYSVSDLSRALKTTVEDRFGHVRVRGEIAECKRHSSGHLYLTLKDENAVLAAVCWRGQVGRLGLVPEIGMEVVCTGKITTYAGQSKYQMVVEAMNLAGVGALLKMLEDRRKKLAAEGLFDPARKKPLPFLPDVIGVISSPTGAVIRDIMHRLQDRFPRRVLLWPVAVQGAGAAAQIAAAVRGFDALDPHGTVPRPDVIIVARGGGSLEDLMPFNDEDVVRAVASCSVPVISAVGHETDTTLIDFAADRRAPTPTAAAEMAVPVRLEWLAGVLDLGKRADVAMLRALADRRERVRLVMRALGDPKQVLFPLAQRLDERAERLSLGIASLLRTHRARLEAARLRHPRDIVILGRQRLDSFMRRADSAYLAHSMRAEKRLDRAGAMLEALSPRAVMQRGYGLVFDAQGRLVTRAQSLEKGAQVTIELYDSARKAKIED